MKGFTSFTQHFKAFCIEVDLFCLSRFLFANLSIFVVHIYANSSLLSTLHKLNNI